MLKQNAPKATEDEGADPLLFPRGWKVGVWALFVFALPLFVAVFSPFYVQYAEEKQRAERRAREAKLRSKWEAKEAERRKVAQAYTNGKSLFEEGRHAEAVRELSLYLEKHPRHKESHWYRGLARLELEDLEGAEEDFTVFIERQRDHANAYRSRGQVRALLGGDKKALAVDDFRRSLDLNPSSAYPAIWIAGLGGGDEALRPFASGTEWINEVARFYLGRLNEAELLARARQGVSPKERSEQLCEAYGYIGLMAERDGDDAKALENYRKCVSTGIDNFIEYRWAQIRLHQEEGGANSGSDLKLEKD